MNIETELGKRLRATWAAYTKAGEPTDYIFRMVAREALAVPPAGGVEEGMVLVPREPGALQFAAYCEGMGVDEVDAALFRRTWGLMIGAEKAALSPTTLREES